MVIYQNDYVNPDLVKVPGYKDLYVDRTDLASLESVRIANMIGSARRFLDCTTTRYGSSEITTVYGGLGISDIGVVKGRFIRRGDNRYGQVDASLNLKLYDDENREVGSMLMKPSHIEGGRVMVLSGSSHGKGTRLLLRALGMLANFYDGRSPLDTTPARSNYPVWNQTPDLNVSHIVHKGSRRSKSAGARNRFLLARLKARDEF
ncbi:MAG: hypothetical protein HYW23_02630 [Candidatus Aenigmarchaeota archaeon]|nr:hypothetical protein [Candidatus Aenigmarchaeota archaeon]